MDQRRAQELLSAERERIEAELAQLEPAAATDGTDGVRDSADAGSELFEQERDAGLSESLRERLAAVQRAEQRMTDGSYGRSVRSGEPIPDDRLEFDPAAELTVEEQRVLEGG